VIGSMMGRPLLVSALLEHAARWHGKTAVVSQRAPQEGVTFGWEEIDQRARRLAQALIRLGVRPGDRVGTLGWNHHRHLEAYYAIPGIGAICHTLNPRLFPEQLVQILQDAQDVGLLADARHLPLLQTLENLGVRLPWVILMGEPGEACAPARGAWFDYEALLAEENGRFDWPDWPEEQAAGLCFTSGTTGRPKGVVYSHRSTVLHAMSVALPDSLGFSACDSVLPVVPLFHANAWGFPHAAALVGAKLVLPGPWLEGATLYALLEREEVTISAGVPTVWRGLMSFLQAQALKLNHLRLLGVGGSACPPALVRYFEQEQQVPVRPGWGMTETSPVAALMSPKRAQMGLSGEARWRWLEKSGRPPFGVDMRLRDSAGREVDRDGKTPGHLEVRGPWICEHYWKEARGAGRAWFPTGDVATLDEDGFLQITDRVKDLIKSGGEWISSVQVEQAALLHPAVREAAVIGFPDPHWGERPLLIMVLEAGRGVTEEELRQHLAQHVARWSIPDRFLVVDSLPYTATGKVDKVALRRCHGEGSG